MDKSELKKISKDSGADLFGVADISKIRSKFNLNEEALEGLGRAISLGLRLSSAILKGIEDHPTKLYYHHYRSVNMFLDQMALRLSGIIQNKGYLAMPIAASQIVDWQKQNSQLSHKEIGYLAGLGWIGRNNLLVNERFGSQFRLVTILTDLDILPDKPTKKDCGDCFKCISVCPAGAIKKRREDFEHLKCFEKLKEFQRKGYAGQYICGICVKVCGARRNSIRRQNSS